MRLAELDSWIFMAIIDEVLQRPGLIQDQSHTCNNSLGGMQTTALAAPRSFLALAYAAMVMSLDTLRHLSADAISTMKFLSSGGSNMS